MRYLVRPEAEASGRIGGVTLRFLADRLRPDARDAVRPPDVDVERAGTGADI